MARALARLILIRDNQVYAKLEKPVEEVLLEYRDDYIEVLEFCDALYDRSLKEGVDKNDAAKDCEMPFAVFYMKALNKALHDSIALMGGEVQPEDAPDMSAESVKRYVEAS